MPATYSIDPSRRVIRVEFSGTINLQALLGILHAAQADPAFDPHFDTIGDYSGVTAVDLQPGDLMAILAGLQQHDLRIGRCAMVTGKHPTMLAYAKVYQNLICGKVKVEHRACETMAEAETWVGLRKV